MVCSILTASALRSKYLSKNAFQTSMSNNRTAVVVGATSGIGEACAHRLAEQGFTVIAVGRHREGRQQTMIETLSGFSKATSEGEDIPKHDFLACDAFNLKDVKKVADSIQEKYPTIDALILTQGMATTQGFTPTVDGNDEKLTLHFWSRMAFINELLPSLQKSQMPKGAVVVSVLSGGVHSAYKDYKIDPELKKNYSVANAADFAGYFNDLCLDQFARKTAGVNFVHASPGFVNTNWGSEFSWMLRTMVRMMQPLGRSPKECAEYMVGPTVLASDAGNALPEKPQGASVIIIGEKGQPKPLTKAHTEEARITCWETTKSVLERAGIEMQ